MTGSELRRRRLAIRGSHGGPMSMQEFASEAGIGWTTLQRWETDKPRTDLRKRGLDELRIDKVIETLERLEAENGSG